MQQLSKLAGFVTHGIRTILYIGLIIMTLIVKYSFTNIAIISIAIVMLIYTLAVCFPETMAMSVKYKAAFEIVVTVVVFLGNYCGLNVNFVLGLFFLFGLNLTFLLSVIADNRK